MFAPRASDVAFGSDVHCVSDVTPDGVVGKHHITASLGEQHHYAQHNITFASAKTSLTKKEHDDLALIYKGWYNRVEKILLR